MMRLKEERTAMEEWYYLTAAPNGFEMEEMRDLREFGNVHSLHKNTSSQNCDLRNLRRHNYNSTTTTYKFHYLLQNALKGL